VITKENRHQRRKWKNEEKEGFKEEEKKEFESAKKSILDKNILLKN
jgi:hypothetical protein